MLFRSCQGSGFRQGPGQGQDGHGSGMGKLGRGEGGLAGIEETNFSTVSRQAKVHTQAGSIIAKQEFEDGQIKGEVSKEFTDAVISAEREVADNIANEKIPRPYQRANREYFKHLVSDVAKPAAETKK